MPTGRLGAKDIDGTTNAVATNIGVYVVPAATIASCNINIVNRGAVDAKIRLALIDGAIGDIAVEDYIEYDFTIGANAVIERTGISLGAAATVLFRSDVVDVNCVITGVEESA